MQNDPGKRIRKSAGKKSCNREGLPCRAHQDRLGDPPHHTPRKLCRDQGNKHEAKPLFVREHYLVETRNV